MERFSRRQFITGGAVAALGGTLALAGCAPSGSSNAKGSNGAGSGSSAGIGSGMGKHGQFDVEVMVTDGNLDRITVLNSRETPGMGDVTHPRWRSRQRLHRRLRKDLWKLHRFCLNQSHL